MINNQYKYLTLSAVLYVTTIILTMFIEDKIVVLGNLKILSGTLIIPLSYAISDIITEVYGYKQMRQIIWISIIALYIVAIVVYVIMQLPTDNSIKRDLAYNLIFHVLVKDIITYSIAALLSVFLNAYVLAKWKILTQGRYFWIRSLGSTAIGEAIFILTWGFLAFYSEFKLSTLFGLMLTSYIYKLLYNIIAIFPCSVIVSILKKFEKVDTYENSISYNPFAWE